MKLGKFKASPLETTSVLIEKEKSREKMCRDSALQLLYLLEILFI
jgi:hypothetical protein